ncbi:MAG: NAD(P)/FAD-dependent oxidoreductase [Myxococcota bacterium]
MSTADPSALVVGAGVVGLACARALAMDGWAVTVAERHGRSGEETSSRNSGVIHAGLYYPPGSRKARSCVSGRRALYAFAARAGVRHAKTGKLVVATDVREGEALHRLRENAEANGVENLAWVGARELARDEPTLRATLALRSAESGIVDAHGLMEALRADAVAHGARVAFGAAIEGLEPRGAGWEVRARGQEPIGVRLVVNAAGHGADGLAAAAGLDVDALGWRLHPWRGDYFTLGSGAPRPRSALVYPIPVRGGLGIHLTRDLGGQTLAGPDAAPGDGLDVDPAKAERFAEAVRRYLPGLEASQLTPAYAGIRPKRRADGAFADFVVEERPAGLIHLVGIESPGLTACLALAEEVRDLAAARR